MEWKDKTSYSRGDKERIPRVLELNIEGLRIVIHRIIHCEGWYLTAYELNINDFFLETEDVVEAKNKGLEVIVGRILKLERIKDIAITKIN
ncbi:hypothetical protein AAK964_10370 [Tissierella praeacuta]|uniref:hypothetical protein n=1 Tax=Tissierella praeacuta TaxID=43131 RepID=UPI0035140E33